jgi:hypothetical protein
MFNSKLVSLLSTLNKEEWLSVKKHIHNYTRKESDIYQIFDFFYQNKSKLSTLEAPEIITQKKFPHLTSKVFLNHMSNLFQLIEPWVIQKEMANDKYTLDLYLIKAFNRRGLYNLANQVQNKLEKTLNENECWDIEKSKAKAIMLHYQYFSNNPIKYEKGGPILQEIIQNYGMWVKEKFLAYKAEMHNWGRIQKYDFTCEINAIDQLVQHFKDSGLSNSLDLLNKIYEIDDVQSLIELYYALINGKYESRSEIETIINIYLIQRLLYFKQKGKDIDDTKIMLTNLYNHGLKNGVFFEHGKLSSISFRNILNTISAIQSYEITEAFINEWVDQVNTVDKDSMQKIAIAINCFYHDRYEEIPLLTRAVKCNDGLEKIIVLILNVVSAFMNRDKEYDLYQHSIENFELLLKRNKSKISEKYMLSVTNLIHFIKSMDKSENISKIDLADYDFLLYRSWCEKILTNRKAATKK